MNFNLTETGKVILNKLDKAWVGTFLLYIGLSVVAMLPVALVFGTSLVEIVLLAASVAAVNLMLHMYFKNVIGVIQHLKVRE